MYSRDTGIVKFGKAGTVSRMPKYKNVLRLHERDASMATRR